MSRYFKAAALSVCLLALGATASLAQVVSPLGFYAGIDAGVIIPQSVSLHLGGAVGGTALNFSGDLNLDTGPATGIIVGYRVSPWWGVEGNFEYAGLGFDSIKGAGTFGGTPFSTNIGLRGHINTFNGLANVLFYPTANQGWYGMTFYVGGGVGFSNVNSSIDSFTVQGTTFTGTSSHSETDLAVNGIVGFDVPVMPQLTIGARYRFLYVNIEDAVSGSGLTGSNGGFMGHVITANATWHF